MPNKLQLATLTLFCPLCIAATPPPFPGECRLVDRIYSAAGNDGTRYGAIELLEDIATHRFGLTDYAVLAKIGIGIDISAGQRLSMGESIVRIRALDKLGQSGLDIAENFLSSLTKESLGPDDTGQVWPAAQVAMQRCLFAKITDSRSKIEFLEAMAKRFYGNVGMWATEELCNSGSPSSLPVIRSSIQREYSNPYSNAEIAFCEVRIELLSETANRVQALSSALQVDRVISNPRLARWAAHQLIELSSSEADRELDRFSRAIAPLPAGSQGIADCAMFWQEIKEARRERDKK
jgi:hypothetical protein